MRWLLLPAAWSLACAAAAAEPPPPKASDVLKPRAARAAASPIDDHFSLRVSYFPASVSTQIRLDRAAGLLGTELSAEDDLGLRKRDDQGRIELILRMRERHRLRFDYFKLTRRGDAVLTRTVNFGDQTFVASDRVSSLLDWRTLNFTYLYSLLRNSRFELGAGLGIHILDGEARESVLARQQKEAESGAAPYPTLALDATWRISRRFALSARADYFSVNVRDGADRSGGSASDYHADVQYRWRRNAAIGLGYTALETRVKVGGADHPGAADLSVDGPELFLRASF